MAILPYLSSHNLCSFAFAFTADHDSLRQRFSVLVGWLFFPFYLFPPLLWRKRNVEIGFAFFGLAHFPSCTTRACMLCWSRKTQKFGSTALIISNQAHSFLYNQVFNRFKLRIAALTFQTIFPLFYLSINLDKFPEK